MSSLALLLVCLCLHKVSNGQVADRSTYGNDFYIGILRLPFNSTDELYITTLSTSLVNFTVNTEVGWNYSGNVSVDQPATVLLPSNSSTLLPLPLHANYSERHKGIHIHSDSPISVIFMLQELQINDEYLAYPYIDLGQQQYEYFVVSANTLSNLWTEVQTLFLLVGNEDSTTITIAPTQSIEIPMNPQDPNSALVLVAPGSAHTVVLHRMQTLLIGTLTGDLTGTAIISDKPLTVISGHECGSLLDEQQWWEQLRQREREGWGWETCSYSVEQIPPTVTWGKKFLLVPFPDELVQHYNKIIASAHATTVIQTCDGSVVATIHLASPGDWNSREWSITYDPGAYCVIESNEPILVMQFSGEGHYRESHFNATYFSQVMSIVPPVEQYINTVLYLPNTHYWNSNHYIQITTTDNSTVLLDGKPCNWTWYAIKNQDSSTVGYGIVTEFSDVKPHVLQHTNISAGLSVTAYGSDDYHWYWVLDTIPTTYAFIIGMKLNPIEIGTRLQLSPWYGHILGGVPVIIAVPTYIKEGRTVTCRFHETEVTCLRISSSEVLCITPQLNITGRVRVHLQHAYNEHDGSFYSQSIDHAHEVNFISNKLLIHPQESIKLTWTPNSLAESTGRVNTTTLLIDIKLHIFTDDSIEEAIELVSGISNNGSYTVTIPIISHSSAQAVYPAIISIEAKGNDQQNPTLYDSAEGTVKQWSNMIWIIVSEQKFYSECKRWSANEPVAIGETLLSTVRSEFPCPPTIGQARTINSGLIQHANTKLMQFLHPNADKCFHQRTITRTKGSSNECCYDSSGQLIVGPTSGGSVDKVSHIGNDVSDYLNNLLSHQQEDILPYIYCCKGPLTNCDVYYERRPSDNGTAYVPPIPAWTIGDPHIYTLDQHKYTFNGKGEFILIETTDKSFTLQGRMVETQNGTASVFSAVVSKTDNSSTVQFEIQREGNVTSLVCLVNREKIDFSEIKSQDFDGVTVYDSRNNSFVATFTSGAYIQVQEQNGFISLLTVGLPTTFHNKTNGLMGVFNGDSNDDMTPRGSDNPLPLNSTLQTIHERFGITWIIDNPGDSIFFYEFLNSWSTYYDPTFTPVYEPVFNDATLKEKANEICGNDEFCKFDIAATGSTEIGEATYKGGKMFEEIVNLSQPIICDPPCVHGACVSTNVCACGEGYEGSTCNLIVTVPCAESANPCNGGGCQYHAGSYICTCPPELSGEFCENNVDLPSDTTTNVGLVVGLTVGLIVSLAIVVMVVVILLVFVMPQRKGNKNKSDKYLDEQEMKNNFRK